MIQIKNVVKIYNKGKQNEFEALHGVSLDIADGEMVAIVGKSGAGKSTLLHIIACIDNYDEGEYYLDDILVKDLKDKESAKIRNEHIGIVMQDYALVEDFSALQNVLLPLDFAKKKNKNRKEEAIKALETVDMKDFMKNPVKELSGGQKQRVAIARAIVNEPQVLLADEPTGALDSNTSNEIMKLFKELNEKGMTIIIITHDEQVAALCDRKITIADGRIEQDFNDKSKNGLMLAHFNKPYGIY